MVFVWRKGQNLRNGVEFVLVDQLLAEAVNEFRVIGKAGLPFQSLFQDCSGAVFQVLEHLVKVGVLTYFETLCKALGIDLIECFEKTVTVILI